ncbi:hypothetical protein Nepgr_015815 [Nepenthes gracilis]|uniref:Uncharacterized protein n=1 Tax=Nepenthes gracilis TaxID=150966 RepID=A0AAD3SNM4_NEPGR|nr:hypothetical protein Nepgr_015815 [Nepenthes gracilis]
MEIASFAGGVGMFNSGIDADGKLIRWDAECCIRSIYGVVRIHDIGGSGFFGSRCCGRQLDCFFVSCLILKDLPHWMFSRGATISDYTDLWLCWHGVVNAIGLLNRMELCRVHYDGGIGMRGRSYALCCDLADGWSASGSLSWLSGRGEVWPFDAGWLTIGAGGFMMPPSDLVSWMEAGLFFGGASLSILGQQRSIRLAAPLPSGTSDASQQQHEDDRHHPSGVQAHTSIIKPGRSPWTRKAIPSPKLQPILYNKGRTTHQNPPETYQSGQNAQSSKTSTNITLPVNQQQQNQLTASCEFQQ